jgi:hypothetical protein
MKILKPTTDVPDSRYHKYSAIYLELEALKNGDWLPIEFDSASGARSFQITSLSHRTLRLETRIRGNIAYVRKKAE